MTRICWRLAEFAFQALQPDERDAVLGDFAESGETGGQALLGVLGLVARSPTASIKRALHESLSPTPYLRYTRLRSRCIRDPCLL